MSSRLELEFEVDQLRDIIVFELKTALGEYRTKLMRARNLLWLVNTKLEIGDVPIEELWNMWQDAVNITFQIIRVMYCQC
jgi:hypothetical protein